MPNYIISMNLIIAADDTQSAVTKGKRVADNAPKEANVEYFLVAEDAKTVKTPDIVN